MLTGLSSMATRQLLADLCQAYLQAGGMQVRFESVGGVDAARRVKAGEPVDLVVLAADAMADLAAAGHVVADSLGPIALSSVAIAARAGSATPDVGSEDALRRAVLAARRIGYSTGPSGQAVLKLFERWGLIQELQDRLVQAAPGVPVANLLVSGAAEIGFQQRSELQDEQGVTLLGPMPPGLEITTSFVGAVCTRSAQHTEARAALDFMGSPATAGIKQDRGMA